MKIFSLKHGRAITWQRTHNLCCYFIRTFCLYHFQLMCWEIKYLFKTRASRKHILTACRRFQANFKFTNIQVTTSQFKFIFLASTSDVLSCFILLNTFLCHSSFYFFTNMLRTLALFQWGFEWPLLKTGQKLLYR